MLVQFFTYKGIVKAMKSGLQLAMGLCQGGGVSSGSAAERFQLHLSEPGAFGPALRSLMDFVANRLPFA